MRVFYCSYLRSLEVYIQFLVCKQKLKKISQPKFIYALQWIYFGGLLFLAFGC